LSYFCKEAAQHAVDFFGLLRHTTGKWRGKPFQLMPWQEHDVIRPLFGTLNDAGLRQYRVCYIEIPKKNGKSELAAGVGIYLLFMDDEGLPRIYSAANTRDQAAIVHAYAAEMVRLSERLRTISRITDSRKLIKSLENDGEYKAVSADAYSSEGLNPSGIVWDELHVLRDREFWKALTDGSMDAREQPLLFIITTAGEDQTSICYEMHEYALDILNGHIQDPTFLPVIYAADKGDDWADPATWRKANPALGITIKEETIAAHVKKLKKRPKDLNSFLRRRLNIWVRIESRFIDLDEWDTCRGTIRREELKGRKCYGGLDLASKLDLAAFVLIFPPLIIGGPYDILVYFFCPERAIDERSNKKRLPYDYWAREGFLIPTKGHSDGKSIDYEHIFKTIRDASKLYKLQEIAFDRWGADWIANKIEKDLRIPLVQFGQGFKSFSEPTKTCEELIVGNRLRHDGNPVLRWNMDNLVTVGDTAGNIKPARDKSKEKIDGAVALIMALDRAVVHEPKPSVYSKRGVLVFEAD